MMSAEMLAANVTAHWIQAGLLMASALVALRLLHVKEPRLKMVMLQAVLLLMLLLPWVQPWRSIQPVLAAQPAVAVGAPSAGISSISAVEAAPMPSVDPARLLLMAIAAGIIARLLWIAFGLVYVRQLLRTARPIDAPEMARQLEPRLGVSARYVEHSRAAGPSTFGIFQPTIALPARFSTLAPGFQRAVVCHELLHVKRRDTLVSLLEELAAAMFWFHPLIWIVRHQIRVAREQAVDATVLDVVGDRSEYVRCLVEMSGHDLMPHLSRAGASMIRSRELRARVNAMFQEVHMSHVRRVVVCLVLSLVVGIAGWTASIYAPLQAMGAARQAGSAEAGRRQITTSYPEYPREALEKGISGTVTVTITINPQGQVSTAAVVDGPQELRASAFNAAMGLAYTPASTTTSTTIYVEYRLDRQSWGVRIGEGVAPRSPIGPIIQENRRTESGALRVGGAIAPPKKIKDVPAEYPAMAQTAKVQGVVILETTIDQTGSVSDVKLLRSIPLLDQAAIEAVKQWQYTPTLLNGVPVPIVMTVTVNFTLRGEARLRLMYQLRITVPRELALTSPETVLSVAAMDVGVVQTKDNRSFGFTPINDQQSRTIKVAIYDVTHARANAGTPPELMGVVEVTPAGGIVQSPTTPSFGIQLLGFEEAPAVPNVSVP